MTTFDDQIRNATPVPNALPASFSGKLSQAARLHQLRRFLIIVLIACLLCTALAAITRHLGYIMGLLIRHPYQYLTNTRYLKTLGISLPWTNLAIIFSLGMLALLLRLAETNFTHSRKTGVTRRSIMTRIISHTRRLALVAAVSSASLIGVSAYAALNPSPLVQQKQAELKRVVDAQGNVTYTVNGRTYVVDPKLTDVERRLTVLGIAQQTSSHIRTLLKPHTGSQGWPTGPHGEQVMSDFYGRVVNVASDQLTIEAPRFWVGGSPERYAFKLNHDTVFQNGDIRIAQTDLHPGQTISVSFYIDPATYNSDKVLNGRNVEVASQELAKATKTLYVAIRVPFTADEYITLLNDGGIQEQSFPGQPLSRDPDGKIRSIVVPSGE